MNPVSLSRTVTLILTLLLASRPLLIPDARRKGLWLNFRLLLGLRCGNFVPGRRAPRLPRRACQNDVTIESPACRTESRPRAAQGQQLLSRFYVPKLYCFASSGARNQTPSFRREGQAEDRVKMSVNRFDEFALDRIKQT